MLSKGGSLRGVREILHILHFTCIWMTLRQLWANYGPPQFYKGLWNGRRARKLELTYCRMNQPSAVVEGSTKRYVSGSSPIVYSKRKSRLAACTTCLSQQSPSSVSSCWALSVRIEGLSPHNEAASALIDRCARDAVHCNWKLIVWPQGREARHCAAWSPS